MSDKRIIYYILAAFVAGILIIIFIQFNSWKNINTLVDSNEQLLQEYNTNSELKDLQGDLISIDTKIKRTVNTDDSSNISGLQNKISAIQSDLRSLQKISDDDVSVKFVDILDTLVQKKLRLSKTILDSLHQGGKTAAQNLIDQRGNQTLTDSIRDITQVIGSSRQKHLVLLASKNDESGRKALNLGTILTILVLLSAFVLFWLIINTIHKQQQLIRQLHISEKRERESVMIKEKFLANMSHEIRTPLNAILGFTNILQRKKLETESKEYVQTIQRAGENLLTIVNDILDLSKIEAGMMRIEAVPFSIRGLTHSVKTIFNEKAKEKKLQLLTWVDQTVPDTLSGDPVRLTQILVNLIGNSLKFTKTGSVNIHITNEGSKDTIINLGITITDTGIGIEAEKVNQIFERFQQADDAVTRKYGGTGLGLSIVHDLIKMQNGTIKVESKPGIGTTFRITIPYKITTEKINSAHLSAIGNTAETIFKETLILVAEDNEMNQSLIRHLFKNWGLPFDIACNGDEAIELLKTRKYDLVLMDIQMPVMDGYTAARFIRDELKLELPIIAMTAHALPGEKEKCLSFGMNEYITKPISEEKLYNLISQAINTKITRYVPVNHEDSKPANSYRFIDLQYMKDISGGNKDYERTVTEQFMEIIPENITSLENMLQHNNISELRKLAHNMKTSISVMGLNNILGPHLDSLEYDSLSPDNMQTQIAAVKSICNSALTEVEHFYATI